jgi:transcription-repair coupling factor (superfamily II helicase)
MSPGEYSVRGGLIDLFPMGSALPYRLDLFGDTIETIKPLMLIPSVRCIRCRKSVAAGT